MTSFPGATSTQTIELDGDHTLEIRAVKPRTYRSWARQLGRVSALELQRVGVEKKEFADCPDHPCHLDGYVTDDGETELTDFARAVLGACFERVPEGGTIKGHTVNGSTPDEVIEMLDWTDLLLQAGMAAFRAHAPSESQKKS